MSTNQHITNYDVIVRRSVLADVVWTPKEAEAFALKWEGILGVPVSAEALYVDGLVFFKTLGGDEMAARQLQSHPQIDSMEGAACCLMCGTLEDPFVGCEHNAHILFRELEQMERQVVQLHTGGADDELAE